MAQSIPSLSTPFLSICQFVSPYGGVFLKLPLTLYKAPWGLIYFQDFWREEGVAY